MTVQRLPLLARCAYRAGQAVAAVGLLVQLAGLAVVHDIAARYRGGA